jgi:hypothetical protein
MGRPGRPGVQDEAAIGDMEGLRHRSAYIQQAGYRSAIAPSFLAERSVSGGKPSMGLR